MSKSNHPLYKSWAQMIRRCSVLNGKDYKNYGGRSIKESTCCFFRNKGKI